MAKIKPAKSRKTSAKSNRGLIPCAFLILMGLALMMLLFYEILKSGAK